MSFIKKIQARLQDRAEAQAKQFSGEQVYILLENSLKFQYFSA